MKTYVIILSKTFPKTHRQAGKPTYFEGAFFKGQRTKIDIESWRKKIHTIRGNYPLWEKRMKEIQEGRACLSIRVWTGKPYRSTQEELVRLTKEDGIGLQRLTFSREMCNFEVDGKGYAVSEKRLAENDGLSYEDWEEWFKGTELVHSLAIIHFTPFRY